MRILQKTISTLLAAQLLFSFGLCGGLCCVKSAELPGQQIVAKAAEQDKSLPPCHRKMAAEKAVARQDHQTHSAQSDHQTHQAYATNQSAARKVATSVLNRDCCAMNRETPDGESFASEIAPQTNKLVAVIGASSWLGYEIAFWQKPIPVQISATHSPPHTGFQLSLRI